MVAHSTSSMAWRFFLAVYATAKAVEQAFSVCHVCHVHAKAEPERRLVCHYGRCHGAILVRRADFAIKGGVHLLLASTLYMHTPAVLSYPTYMTLPSVHIPPVFSLLIANAIFLSPLKP